MNAPSSGFFTQTNVVAQHFSSFRLKGQGSLMVIISGDWLFLRDVIAPCWCTGDGDSAFPTLSPSSVSP